MRVWIEAQTYGHLEGDNFHLQEYLGAHKEKGENKRLLPSSVWAPQCSGGGSDW